MLKHHIANKLIRKSCLLSAMLLCLFQTACNAVYDDLNPCPQGINMRFIFDYNLERANSFPQQVDCLSVFIFDEQHKLVEHIVETSSVLAEEDWRMEVDLPAGDYHAVAYGGLECADASFHHIIPAQEIKTLSDLEVLINGEHVGEDGRPERPLHDLYHGQVDFTVTEGLDYDRVTLPMMRDTNHIRVVLQHLDNTAVNPEDFDFQILDDNTHISHNNDIVAHGEVKYTPWQTGVAFAGLNGISTRADDVDGEDDVPENAVQVAYAEMSVSRLMHKSHYTWTQTTGKTQQGPRLQITSKEHGRTVADLPLNNYLLLTKPLTLNMGNQEYLDRANRYSLVLFLDHDNAWVSMNIIVDDWTVRDNNTSF